MMAGSPSSYILTLTIRIKRPGAPSLACKRYWPTHEISPPLRTTGAIAEHFHRDGGHSGGRSRHRHVDDSLACAAVPARRIDLPVLVRHGVERLFRCQPGPPRTARSAARIRSRVVADRILAGVDIDGSRVAAGACCGLSL